MKRISKRSIEQMGNDLLGVCGMLLSHVGQDQNEVVKRKFGQGGTDTHTSIRSVSKVQALLWFSS